MGGGGGAVGGAGGAGGAEALSAQGKTPRFFGLDPTGAYLIAANQDSNNIVVFKIDQKTGGLTPTGDTLELASPVCIVYIPAP